MSAGPPTTSEKPLAGRTVVVTRTRAQAAELADLLADQGAVVLEFPTIRTVAPEDWGVADAAISSLGSYDWVVFSSANAVRAFLDRVASGGHDVGVLSGVRVAAVGPATAAKLAARGVRADFVPDAHRAEGVVDGFVERGVGAGSRVLIPRALEAREILPETLRQRGAAVDVVPVYRTVLGEGDPAVLERLAAGSVDAVTFTSSSTARNFVHLTRGLDRTALDGVLAASIGPVTTGTLRELGIEPRAESADSTVPGLVRAVAEYYARSAD